MNESFNGVELRRHLRVPRNFNMIFYVKDSFDRKQDESYTKDISRGGLRFTNSQFLESGTRLGMEVKIPYIAPRRALMEGLVVSCQGTKSRLVFETGVKFTSMDPQIDQVLDIIEKHYIKGT
ncbi:MAG: PilZ domain-containing protein [Candidatus Omnitrophica bacterium]|nr:PilZ domain-containing protein [Candidatus Omnitrophota bacterium]